MATKRWRLLQLPRSTISPSCNLQKFDTEITPVIFVVEEKLEIGETILSLITRLGLNVLRPKVC